MDLERAAQKKLGEAWAKRRELLKTIPKFWPVALMNDPRFALHVQYPDDRKAFMHLEDVWVQRDAEEPRSFTVSLVSGCASRVQKQLMETFFLYADVLGEPIFH